MESSGNGQVQIDQYERDDEQGSGTGECFNISSFHLERCVLVMLPCMTIYIH